MPSRIAVLIDAENISHNDYPDILDVLAQYHDVNLIVIYGDWEKPSLQKWHAIAVNNEYKIRHQTNHPQAKNSSDMRLIMDAMDIVHYRQDIDTFCIISNDADYIALCDKLHESQKYVIGIGYRHASDAFIRACNQFIFIGTQQDNQPSLQSQNDAVNGAIPNPKKLLERAFDILPDSDGWVHLGGLGSAIRKVHPKFDVKDYGHTSFKKWLQTMPQIVEIKTNGSISSARLRKQRKSDEQRLIELVKNALANIKDGKKWIPLTKLGQELNKLEKGFATKQYGHSTLTKLVRTMPSYIEFREDKNGNSIRPKK